MRRGCYAPGNSTTTITFPCEKQIRVQSQHDDVARKRHLKHCKTCSGYVIEHTHLEAGLCHEGVKDSYKMNKVHKQSIMKAVTQLTQTTYVGQHNVGGVTQLKQKH